MGCREVVARYSQIDLKDRGVNGGILHKGLLALGGGLHKSGESVLGMDRRLNQKIFQGQQIFSNKDSMIF